MGIRIHKALGYGTVFPNYEAFQEALTEEFHTLLSEDRYEEGVPLQRYLDWMMKNSGSGDRSETNFVMDSLLSEDKKASKISLADIVNIVESVPSGSETAGSDDGIGFLIRPMQVVNSGDWFRTDDTLDYYSDPDITADWKESDYSFIPYDTSRRVHRESGEFMNLSTSEFLHAKRTGGQLDYCPDWEKSIPAGPVVLSEIVEALNIFVDKETVLVPVIATWWQ